MSQLTTTPKRVGLKGDLKGGLYIVHSNKMFYISHFTQPSSAAKSGYATRRSVSDFPMSPVLFEQRREAAFGGQVNSCPFGSFWASKMNVKY